MRRGVRGVVGRTEWHSEAVIVAQADPETTIAASSSRRRSRLTVIKRGSIKRVDKAEVVVRLSREVIRVDGNG